MSSPHFDDWLEEIAARRLSPDEVAQLRARLERNPAERQRLEDELALNRALDASPRPAPSTNFTRRVLDAIDAEDRAGRRTSSWARWPRWSVRWLLPATAALALVLGWQWMDQRQRVHLAAGAVAVTQAADVPGVAMLRDFEAIQLLNSRPTPDDVALISALREPTP
jgi:hypothetical protein